MSKAEQLIDQMLEAKGGKLKPSYTVKLKDLLKAAGGASKIVRKFEYAEDLYGYLMGDVLNSLTTKLLKQYQEVLEPNASNVSDWANGQLPSKSADVTKQIKKDLANSPEIKAAKKQKDATKAKEMARAALNKYLDKKGIDPWSLPSEPYYIVLDLLGIMY